MDTLISNIVLNIKTNLSIDLKKFVSNYGGIYSKILPAARRIVNINGLRYSFLIYSTGIIILSNFHISFNQSELFSWIFSLLKTIIKSGIAKILDETNRLKVNLLVENICCASNIDLCKRFEKMKNLQNVDISLHQSFNLQKQLNYELLDSFMKNLLEIENVQSATVVKRNRFPAKIIKLKLKRDWLELYKHKSDASRKRKIVLAKINRKKIQNLYEIQNCTIAFFLNGKLTITGSQTKQDFKNILQIFFVLFNSIFPNF